MRTALLIALLACLLISTQAFVIDNEVRQRVERETGGLMSAKEMDEFLAILAGEEGGDETELEKVWVELEEMQKHASN